MPIYGQVEHTESEVGRDGAVRQGRRVEWLWCRKALPKSGGKRVPGLDDLLDANWGKEDLLYGSVVARLLGPVAVPR